MRISIYFLLVGLVIGSCSEEINKNSSQVITRPDYYVDKFEYEGSSFKEQTKVAFEYDEAGSLERYTVFGFNTNSGVWEEQIHFIFSRLNDRVDSIKGFFLGNVSPNVEYGYSYLADGRVDKIVEINHAAGVNTEADFAYIPETNTIEVTYSFSNGSSFKYEFEYLSGNILQDKTTSGSSLCNEGMFTYDSHNNPLHGLGYVDFYLRDFSVNNRLTERVEYTGCSFPSLVPEFYSFEYNDDEFPKVITTYYKGGVIRRSQREFFYKSFTAKYTINLFAKPIVRNTTVIELNS